jgi:hypothetical protein
MTISLAAPFSAPTSITLLPNPIFGNAEGIDSETSYDEAIDGNPHTYVKRSGNMKLAFQFANIGRGKLLEVQELLQAYVGEQIRLIDHNGDVWRVVAISPVSLTIDGLAINSGGPRKESGSFTLEFIGAKVT